MPRAMDEPRPVSPRERISAVSEALDVEAKWMHAFFRELAMSGDDPDLAGEVKALSKSCRLLAMRMRTLSTTG